MKWTLVNSLYGTQYTFEMEIQGHELKIYARNLDKAVELAKAILGPSAIIDIEDLEEE